MNKSTHILAPASLMGSLDPADPASIDRLLNFHRATFGAARMDANEPPERPEGVSEEEWGALGDPGKAAIVRERERATRAERDLAAARAPKLTPPAPAPTKPAEKAPDDGKGADKGGDGEPDLAKIIEQAVQAAVQPFQQRQDQWEADQAASKVQDAVRSAAGPRFHDATDVLAQVDLTSLTDGNGGPDGAKINAALDDLATRKPHLVKPWDDRRRVAPGSPIGSSGPASVPLDDRVKASLQRMQAAAGLKPAS